MYNYGTSAAEILEPVFEVLQGGAEVTADNIVEFVADNGAKIADVTVHEVTATNGTATSVAEVVDVSAGATTGTATGAGFLAMDVGVAGAAIAPALGVAAGFGLYSLAPEFWDNIANELMEAGATVKGKVVALVDANGQTAFPENVIEIFKNALVNSGIYEGEFIAPQGEYNETSVTSISRTTLQETLYNTVRLASTQQGVEDLPSVEDFYTHLALNHLSDIENGVGFGFVISRSNQPYGLHIFTQNSKVTLNSNAQTLIITNVILIMMRIVNGVLQTWYRQEGVNFTCGKPSSEAYIFNGSPFYGYSTIDGVLNNAFFSGLGAMDKSALEEGATYPSTQPFPETYPNWQPSTYPEPLPETMPQHYPVELPDNNTNQESAQEGENTNPSQLDDLVNLFFNTIPAPNPDITPDYDPSAETEPQPQPQPDPEPNPPDPNPPVPTPIGTLPIPTLDTTRADRMFTVYNPTDANVNNLGAFLWTDNVIEQIKKLWEDPMQAIISFHKIYGAPTVGGSSNIVLGYINSGVSAPVVTSQFCDVDCGSVVVPELLNNATSYAPFTSLHIYLPFIGIMELDTNECMKATLHVKYRIDVYTGTCIALIYVSRYPDLTNEQILYTFSGNASQQLPLTSSSFGGAISALLGLAGAGVAVASGGALGVAAGAVSAAHSLTQEMVHINRSGGLSANAGILAPRTPYLILSRQYGYDANGYAGFYGYPSNKTVYIGNCNGYIRCKDVIFRGSCTQAEAEEIESLLKSGVYV